MDKYEIAICVKDEDDLANGHKRKKEGDVVTVVPWKRKSTTEVDHWEQQTINGKVKNVPIMKDINEAWNWGREEIDKCFVMIVQSSKSREEIMKYGEAIWKRDDTQAELTEAEAKTLMSQAEPVKCSRIDNNRYSISVDKIKNFITDLGETKFQDKTCIYQPFKKASQLMQKFNVENYNKEKQRIEYCLKNSIDPKYRKTIMTKTEYEKLANIDYGIDIDIIDENDVDCVSADAAKEVEKTIDFDSEAAFIYDKKNSELVG